MKNKKKVLISILLIALLVIIFYLITNFITKYTGFSVSEGYFDKKDDFKLCLKTHDITLYINSEIPGETLKKIIAYEYLDDISIFNCIRNNQDCIKKEVNGPFPAWIINNKKIDRDISIQELSEFSGCEL